MRHLSHFIYEWKVIIYLGKIVRSSTVNTELVNDHRSYNTDYHNGYSGNRAFLPGKFFILRNSRKSFASLVFHKFVRMKNIFLLILSESDKNAREIQTER